MQKAINWGTMIFLAFIWGSSFILMKKGLESFTALQIGAYRIFIAFISVAPFAFKHLKKINRTNFLPLLSVGLFGSLFPAFLFPLAQTKLDSSLTGMLNSLVPLFTLIFGILFFGFKTKIIAKVGVLVGFLGAAGLVISFNNGIKLTDNLIYSIFPILATIMYGTNVNVIKKHLQGMPSVEITALSFFMVAPLTSALLFVTDMHKVDYDSNTLINLLYITLLGVLGTSLAIWVFNILIKKTTALFASSVTYLIPMVAIIWGILDGENIKPMQYIFMGVIFTGVYLISGSQNKS